MSKTVDHDDILIIGIDPGTIHQGLFWGTFDPNLPLGVDVDSGRRSTIDLIVDINDRQDFFDKLLGNEIMQELIEEIRLYRRIRIGVELPTKRIHNLREKNRKLKRAVNAREILVVTSWWTKFFCHLNPEARVISCHPSQRVYLEWQKRTPEKDPANRLDPHQSAAIIIACTVANPVHRPTSACAS